MPGETNAAMASPCTKEKRLNGRDVNTSSRERDRKMQLLSFWHQRPDGQRTEKDVLVFYGQMERAFPHLLKRTGGDPYQNLKSDLEGHIEEPKTTERKKR